MLTSRTLTFRKPPVVFRRWSRSGYAQFVSMKREVVIAPLKASICYASMLKQGILMNDDHSPEIFRRNGTADDDDGPGGTSLLSDVSILTLSLITELTIPCAPCAADGRQGDCVSASTFVGQRAYGVKYYDIKEPARGAESTTFSGRETQPRAGSLFIFQHTRPKNQKNLFVH